MVTVGEIRETLAQHNARWMVRADWRDNDTVPEHPAGASSEGLSPAGAVIATNFTQILLEERGNPFLVARRVQRGFLLERQVRKFPLVRELLQKTLPRRGAAAAVTADTSAAPAHIDWRQRWGWPWISTVRDQNGCGACWAFATTALVEAMVRIEHAVWCTRSEGDVHKGIGAQCADRGGAERALNWMRQNGIADPACFPWTTADIPYMPTPDRSGRTVKIPARTDIGSVIDQKTWLDTVGPLVTWFDVWHDFDSYGSGVYHKQAMIGSEKNYERGGHYMLVVGYDDIGSYWICKNSWGRGWGEAGYVRVGYGECGIDTYAKIGLRYTNPDPWTKRNMHSGCMLESGNGNLHRNFELLATADGSKIRHWWRDGSNLSWYSASLFGDDVAAFPTLTATTFNRNFELVYLTSAHRLHRWSLDQFIGTWQDGGIFGPPDANGVSGFLQNNNSSPGNLDAVVRTTDCKLSHWSSSGGWHEVARFGANVAYSGATLLQSACTARGKFELVCVLANGQMQHWCCDSEHGMVWSATVLFGSNVQSSPCMIEGQSCASDETKIGNLELCVAVGGQVQHWWRDNVGSTGWHFSTAFGHDVKAIVALVEGSYGFNLEVIVLRTDNKLQHYWRFGSSWNEGVIIGSA